jgi:small-conductance mechanosensitive channel/CRP-like cAMP-binding protein/tellurite resistance protein
METATQWLQVVGLTAILALATFVFARGVTLTIRGKHHTVRFGVELLLVFSILYYFFPHALQWLGFIELVEPLEKGLAFLWWISLAFTINASLNRFVWKGVLSDNGVRRIPKLLTDGATLLIYGGAVLIVLHYVYDQSVVTIMATSGALAFIVGLSAQSTLSQVFAGFSLNVTKSLRIGDYVEIDDIYGRVYEINWRSVSLLNPHTGSLYIFPNSEVADKIILNFSEPTDLFKYYLKFHVEYSASPELVISTIAEALEKTKYIRRDPKPDFNILGFTDLGMEYRVRYYFDGDDPWWDAQNEMCMTIWSSLRRKGIRLSIDRHKLLSGDEQESNPWKFDNITRPDDNLSAEFASDAFLGQFSSELREELMLSARYVDYTPPDCVYTEGDLCGDVYYIADGEFSVLQTQENGSEAQIGSYNDGACIGLGCLAEGSSSRVSTVRAERYSSVYILPTSLLREMLSESESAQAALMAELSNRLEQQKRYLQSHADSIARDKRLDHHATVNLHVREHVEDIFSKPFLHRFLHVLSPRTIERDLLEAIMAASALIATARGEVDDTERDFLRDKFSAIGLFEHVEIDESLKLFELDIENIRADEQRGTHTALAKVRAISGESRLAHIVMGIAHGMTDVHGDLLDSEKLQLKKIAETLNLTAEIEGLAGHIKS